MSRLPPGDPAKMAKVINGSVDQNPAPKRIALGSDPYGAIHKALTDRLSALEAQREVAFSTDFPKGRAASEATCVRLGRQT
jgi:hypothetical protein